MLGLTETNIDIKLIQHLIIKVVKYTWIIFNYSILKSNCIPLVVAFKVLDKLTFLTIRFHYPGLEERVNNTIEI